MKIRKITLFILLIISLLPANAQIATEIKNYVDSTELIINNGRKMVYQTLHIFEWA